jgi:hypothetical protein
MYMQVLGAWWCDWGHNRGTFDEDLPGFYGTDKARAPVGAGIYQLWEKKANREAVALCRQRKTERAAFASSRVRDKTTEVAYSYKD